MKYFSSFVLFVSCVVSLGAQPVGAPLLPLNDLQPGMKGEVWTVFKGHDPEPFSVQVTGILRNALGPGKSMILCELTDPRVQSMGAVAGMSGSPLYIDGKLAGVLSYQIQHFETVRYAGFTPISDMLEVSALPPGRDGLAPAPIPVKGDRGASRSAGTLPVQFSPLTPTFSVGGLSPDVAALLEPRFQALGLSINGLGGNDSGSDNPQSEVPNPKSLRPGDVVAVALAVGDISLAGTGTVSYVDGSHILAFGHPMLRLGATELPMASSEIVAPRRS
ncbi:MAG TPA: SpoIVB peptidase S55 domain-containing protein, partial [Lacunisphaera sp.]|nr:SpoIVB peptidase S55 domain-containing protein [Lacunisphaera sp.]